MDSSSKSSKTNYSIKSYFPVINKNTGLPLKPSNKVDDEKPKKNTSNIEDIKKQLKYLLDKENIPDSKEIVSDHNEKLSTQLENIPNTKKIDQVHDEKLSTHSKTSATSLQDKKPYECDTCSKLFPNSVSLDIHRKLQHTEDSERPFKCEDCQRSYKLKSSLNKHLKSHTHLGIKLTDSISKNSPCYSFPEYNAYFQKCLESSKSKIDSPPSPDIIDSVVDSIFDEYYRNDDNNYDELLSGLL